MPETAQVRTDLPGDNSFRWLSQRRWISLVGISTKPSVILPTLAN